MFTMAGNIGSFVMLLLWAVVGGDICERKEKGVLHGRVELHIYHEPQHNVKRVEWAKYKNSASTRLLYTFDNEASCMLKSCQNIEFNVTNMSLIFLNLTKKDEGLYEKKIVLADNRTVTCNITLSVLSPPTAVRIAVSTSNRTLTLRCEVKGVFLNLHWLRDGLLLADDQKISISERNMTVHVSHLNSSDWGQYTCRVSNEDGTSEAHVNITEENTTFCHDNIEQGQQLSTELWYLTGFAVIPIMLVCIILTCIYRKGWGYDEFTSSEVECLPCLHEDFIKPKALQQTADNGELAEVFYNTAEL